MANEKPGLLAIKVGMTQIFNDDNKVVPVTVLDLSGNTVVRVKTQDSKDGYNAVQLGLGEQKEERLSKPQAGHFKKAGVSAKRYLREVRVSDSDLSKYEAGSELAASDFFSAGQKIDVTGTSKGRGFAGVMKRYNFAGFITSHGTHEFFRHGGSIDTSKVKLPNLFRKGLLVVSRIEVHLMIISINLWEVYERQWGILAAVIFQQ